MAHQCRPITDDQWDSHKASILELYLNQSLPLQNKHGTRTVVQEMENKHNFSASQSQYEAQFKRWNVSKNLKGHEWKQVLTKMDQLRARGIETRPKVSGQVIGDEKIRRARRLYLQRASRQVKQRHSSQDIFGENHPRVTLEVRTSNDEWVPYEDEIVSAANSFSSLPSTVGDNDALGPDKLPAQPNSIDNMSLQYVASKSDWIATSRGQGSELVEDTASDPSELFMCQSPIQVQDSSPLIWPPMWLSGWSPFAMDLDSGSNVTGFPKPMEVGNNSHLELVFSHTRTSQKKTFLTAPETGTQALPHSQDKMSLNEKADTNFDTESTPSNPAQDMAIVVSPMNSRPRSPSRLSIQGLDIFSFSSEFNLSPLISESFPVIRSSDECPSPVQGHMLQSAPPELNQISRWGIFNQKSPFFQLQSSASLIRDRVTEIGVQASEEIDLSLSTIPASSNKAQMPHRHASISRLQGATRIICDYSSLSQGEQMPDVEEFIDRLESLLPDLPWDQGKSSDSLDLATPDAIFDSPFHRALLYSILNGLAGFTDLNVSSSWILRMMKSQEKVRSRLFQCLSSGEAVIAIPLAVSLFQAAVESCDAQVVDSLLQVTQGKPSAIDVNEVVCRFDGRQYTPIELASKLSSLEVVKILVKAGADPEMTYSYQDIWKDGENKQKHGALALAIEAAECNVSKLTNMALIRELVNSGAKVKTEHIRLALIQRNVNESIFSELFSRLPLQEYPRFFKSYTTHRSFDLHRPRTSRLHRPGPSLLSEITWHLENEMATRIIKHILSKHQELYKTEYCSRFPETCRLNDTLVHALKKKNLELVEILLSRMSEIHSRVLSAAIRSGDPQLIELLLGQNVRINDAPDPDPLQDACRFCPLLSTPLAEAIRSRKQGLISRLEKCGALSQIHVPDFFERAIEAASESGDTEYVEMLLRKVPNLRARHLTVALILAIRNGNTATALVLLAAGAAVTLCKKSTFERHIHTEDEDPFIEALRRHDSVVVDAILECDIDLENTDDRYLETAISWGNLAIIKGLLSMQVTVSSLALRAAVRSGEEALLRLILKYCPLANLRFESTNALIEAVKSSNYTAINILHELGVHLDFTLHTAVSNKDHSMIKFLLSKGADPADERSLLDAIKHDRDAWKLIFDAFLEKYPRGLTGFGVQLLMTAIHRNDLPLLKDLQKAHIDVTCLSWVGWIKQALSEAGTSKQTPLAYAINSYKGKNIALIQVLLDAGCNPDDIGYVLSHSRSDDADVWPRETAFMLAIRTRNLQIVALLLSHGANVNHPARRGVKRTPLQLACEIGSFKIVQLLLDWKADVNGEPAVRGGGTALQLAAISGSIKIVHLLLDKGADVLQAPSQVNGRSAFEGAAEYGRLDMLKAIWNAAALRSEGISAVEARRALLHARENGHGSCVEYIAYLVPAVAVLEVSGNDEV